VITTLTFTPVTGSVITLNTDPPGYPVEEYDCTVQDRVDMARTRMQAQGVWPTYPYEGGMEIRMAGHIIGTDSNDYTARRHALVAAWRRDTGPTARRHGTLLVRYDGESEDWNADVVVTAFAAPRGGLSPAISPWSAVFFSWLPYFIGASSGNHHYDG
jgi:hypothetical protein